jgi:uncharacterized PurR-regulated membrane protein YhhQ (DUF165 family)
MTSELLILIAEAIGVYFLVLWAHSLRSRASLAPFHALMGSLTAVMSWVTDAGVKVDLPGVSLMVGSTVFYTSLLLGVFVVYVFDGVRATRIAIATITGVSVLVPLIALILRMQLSLSETPRPLYVPVPSLRINTASVLATLADLIFLAIAWEFLGKPRLRMPIWLRSFLTLLGVMWLDVILFSTGAFFGHPGYEQIVFGTLASRLLICLFAYPFLFLYLRRENARSAICVEHRPVLSILKEVTDVRLELTLAQQEIERRKLAEAELSRTVAQLHASREEIAKLREGLVTVCAWTKRVQHDGRWMSVDEFMGKYLQLNLTHGMSEEALQAALAEIGSLTGNPPA